MVVGIGIPCFKRSVGTSRTLRLTYRASQIYLLLWMQIEYDVSAVWERNIGTGLKSLTQFDEFDFLQAAET